MGGSLKRPWPLGATRPLANVSGRGQRLAGSSVGSNVRGDPIIRGFLELSLCQTLAKAPGCGVGYGEMSDIKSGFRKDWGQGFVVELANSLSSDVPWMVGPVDEELVGRCF